MNNARCHPKTIIARVPEGEDSKQLIEQVPKLHIMIGKMSCILFWRKYYTETCVPDSQHH